MIEEIERLLKKSFKTETRKHINDRHEIQKKDLTPMFNENIVTFRKYLSDDLSPKISKLQDTFFKYDFDSPLDFIMIKSDFKRFFESFT